MLPVFGFAPFDVAGPRPQRQRQSLVPTPDLGESEALASLLAIRAIVRYGAGFWGDRKFLFGAPVP